MANTNEVDILPEEEEEKSISWKIGEGAWTLVAKTIPVVGDVAEEVARWVVKWVPKFWTFVLDTIVNGLDIAWDVTAHAVDIGSGAFAWFKNELTKQQTGTKWTATWTSFAAKEWMLDKLNAESDEVTTAMDEAVDEFFTKPEFNTFHTLDDTMMKDILNFVWESVSYFVWGKWITLPTKLIFANKNAAQTKVLMDVIVKNNKIAKTKGLATAITGQASAKANEAKTILTGLIKSWKIALKDPNKGINANNIIVKSAGDSKYINWLISTYDKAFNKVIGAVEKTVKANPLKVWGAALAVWTVGWVTKNEEWEETADTTESLWEDKSPWQTIVEQAGDAWDKVTDQVDTALTGNVYWDRTKNFFKDSTDMTVELFGELKTKFSELGEDEQSLIADKMDDWNSTEAINELSEKGYSTSINIELPWLLDWEEKVYYNWLDANIWALKDWDQRVLDENINSYWDAELAEWNMQDYVQTYYE